MNDNYYSIIQGKDGPYCGQGMSINSLRLTILKVANLGHPYKMMFIGRGECFEGCFSENMAQLKKWEEEDDQSR